MPAARVDASGNVTLLDRPPQPDETITPEDAADQPTLARTLSKLLKDVASLLRRANAKRIDFEDVIVGANGASVKLPHHFDGRARWSVVGWDTPTAAGGPFDGALWILRAFFGSVTLTSGAANSSVGNRFQVSAKTRIAGARVAWRSSGGAKTLKVSLWRDSDGARLASGTGAVNSSGLYIITFDTPIVIDGSDLNVDLTLSVYDQAGANFTYTGTDAAFTALLNMQFPGVLLKALNLSAAGDARTTTTSGTELYWLEPLIAPSHPGLVEDMASSDSNVLALKSYVPGVATIRVEEAG